MSHCVLVPLNLTPTLSATYISLNTSSIDILLQRHRRRPGNLRNDHGWEHFNKDRRRRHRTTRRVSLAGTSITRTLSPGLTLHTNQMAISHNTASSFSRYKYSEYTFTRSHLAYKIFGDIAQHGEFLWQVHVQRVHFHPVLLRIQIRWRYCTPQTIHLAGKRIASTVLPGITSHINQVAVSHNMDSSLGRYYK